MKRIFFVVLFALAAVGAMAQDQQPLFIVNARKASLEEINDLKNRDIVLIQVFKGNAEVERFKHLGDVSNGVVFIHTEIEEENAEFAFAEEMPKFMGGDLVTFRSWVMQNLRYPQEAITKGINGKIVVSFMVDKKGFIDAQNLLFLEVPEGENMLLRNEIIRLFSKAPQWTPGKQKGEPVNVRFTLPLSFVLTGEIVPTDSSK